MNFSSTSPNKESLNRTNLVNLSSPPPLTGGQKSQSRLESPSSMVWRLDWLGATVVARLREVQASLAAALGCEIDDFVDTGHGGQGYRHLMLGPHGSKIYWGATDPETQLYRDDIHFVLPGQACAVVEFPMMLSLLRFVDSRGGKVTVVHAALDDYQRRISPNEFRAWAKTQHCISHALKGRDYHSWNIGSSEPTNEDTCYIGRPTSRKQLRVYDKGAESKGEIDAVRFELVLKQEAAESFIHQLLARPDLAGQIIAGHLQAFVDFRELSEDHHTERRPVMAWWAELLGAVVKAETYVLKVARTIEDKLAWLEKGVSATLALAMKHWKGDIEHLYRLLHIGENKLRPKHLALLGQSTGGSVPPSSDPPRLLWGPGSAEAYKRVFGRWQGADDQA